MAHIELQDDGRFMKPLYRRYLISSMLAIFGNVLGQTVTVAIIGRALGPEDLSVIGVTLPIYYVYATAGALLGVGGTAVCARLTGARDYVGSRRAFTAVYILTILISAFLTTAILVFAKPVTALLGVSPDMAIYGKVLAYTRVLSIGGVFIMCIYPAFNLLRLDGRNRLVIAVFAVQAAVSILTAVLCLLVFRIGVTGAAVATVAGAGVAGVWGALLLIRGSRIFSLELPGIKSILKKWFIEIVWAGSPSALENLCVLTRTVALNWIIVKVLMDMTAISSLKIIDSVNSVALVIIAGASGSLIPLAGVFHVEKDAKSVRQLLWLTFRWGGVMTAAFTALCIAFSTQVAGAFGLSGSLAALAVRLFAASLPLSLVNNVLVCLYQACHRTAAANILTLGRSLVWVVLPAFVLSKGMGATGIWHSFWIAEAAALVLAVPVSLLYRRKNKYLSSLFLLDAETETKGICQSFSVKSTPEAIAGSASGIVAFCEANDLLPKQVMAISLSIEEILMSIREHCFCGDDETASVRVLIYEEMAIMRIRNAGKPFNPIEYYENLRESQSAEDMIMSDGLGIKMILELAETVDYQSTFGVNNITVVL